VFFSRPYVHVSDSSRPRVLALYADNFIGEIRIKPFLNALLARGVIAEYQAADRSMKLIGPLKSFRFTHIWCQRAVSTAQFAFLRRHSQVPIVYDIDDLLTSVPDFVSKVKARTRRRIEWCLHHARTVTVSSERLRVTLREDVPALGGEIIVLKNGCAHDTIGNGAAPQKKVIWTSSDLPFALHKHPGFAERLSEIVNRAGYEAILIGRFGQEHTHRVDRCRQIAYLDFLSYREYLRSCAGAIGLAPLPTDLPPAAQRYFDAKSDIKLVDYLSAGIVPICNSAVPYATSSLFLPRLAATDVDGLLGRLEACIADHGRMIEYTNDTIRTPGLLRQREFSALSTAVDHLFA
jgi:hypothetical protein